DWQHVLNARLERAGRNKVHYFLQCGRVRQDLRGGELDSPARTLVLERRSSESNNNAAALKDCIASPVHIAADDIEYHIYIARVFFERSLIVWKYFLSPERAHKINIGVRACCDHRRTAQAGDLHRHASDTSGSSVDQNAHSRLDVSGLHQADPGADACERQ